MSHVKWGERTYGADKIQVFQWGEGAKCNIGKYCSVADGVKVFLGGDHQVGWTTTFPFEKKTGTHGDINIGNDVWLSHGVTIMSGVTIGDGAVVAANSHVVKDVEPYTVVGGNPAKYLKHRFEGSIVDGLMELKWWDLHPNIIRDLEKELCEPPTRERVDSWLQRFRRN